MEQNTHRENSKKNKLAAARLNSKQQQKKTISRLTIEHTKENANTPNDNTE